MIEDNITDITTAPAEQPVPIIDEQTQQVDVAVTPEAPPPVEPEKPAVVLKDIDFFNNNVDWHNSNLAEGEKPLVKYKFAQDIPDEEYNGLKAKVEVETVNWHNKLSEKHPELKIGKIENAWDINKDNYDKLVEVDNVDRKQSELTQYNEIVKQLPSNSGIKPLKNVNDFTPELLDKAKAKYTEKVNLNLKKQGYTGEGFKDFGSIDWKLIDEYDDKFTTEEENKKLREIKSKYKSLSDVPEFKSKEDADARRSELNKKIKELDSQKTVSDWNEQAKTINAKFGVNVPIVKSESELPAASEKFKKIAAAYGNTATATTEYKKMEFPISPFATQPGGVRGDIPAPNLATEASQFNWQKKREDFLKESKKMFYQSKADKEFFSKSADLGISPESRTLVTGENIGAPLKWNVTIEDEVAGNDINDHKKQAYYRAASDQLNNDISKLDEQIKATAEQIKTATPDEQQAISEKRNRIIKARGILVDKQHEFSSNRHEIRSKTGSTAGAFLYKLFESSNDAFTGLFKWTAQGLQSNARWMASDDEWKSLNKNISELGEHMNTGAQLFFHQTPENVEDEHEKVGFLGGMVPYVVEGEIAVPMMFFSSFNSNTEKYKDLPASQSFVLNSLQSAASAYIMGKGLEVTKGHGVINSAVLNFIEQSTGKIKLSNLLPYLDKVIGATKQVGTNSISSGLSFAVLNPVGVATTASIDELNNVISKNKVDTQDFVEVIKQMGESAVGGMKDGVILGGVMTPVNAYRTGKLNRSTFSDATKLRDQRVMSSNINIIKQAHANGKIDKQTASNAIKNLVDLRKSIASIDEKLSIPDQYEAWKIMQDNKRLDHESSGLSDFFKAPYERQKQSNNEKLQNIAMKHDQVYQHEKEGGSSFVNGKNAMGSKGTSVSIFPERTVIIDRPLTQKDLDDFKEKNKDILEGNEDVLSVGTWKDGEGKTNIDISSVTPHAEAEELGKKYNQQAVFNLEKGTSVPTGGTGEEIEGLKSEAERIKDIREIAGRTKASEADFKPISLEEVTANLGENNKIIKAVRNGMSAVSGLSDKNNISINFHDTNTSMQSAMNKGGAADKEAKKTRGNFSYIRNDKGGWDMSIDINLKAGADATTIRHEFTHGVLLHAFGEAPEMINKMKDAFRSYGNMFNDSKLLKFADIYAKEDSAEEYLAELSAISKDIKPGALAKIAEFINNVSAKYLGDKFVPFKDVNDSNDIIRYFGSMANAVRTGAPVEIREMATKESENKAEDESVNTKENEDKEIKENSISSKQQSVTISEGKETAKKLGLKGKFNNVRDIAEALEERQRKKYGIINRDDRSGESSSKIAKWMKEEVSFFVDLMKEKSGIGWYGKNFQESLDVMSDIFPEFKTDKKSRDLFTMLVAITSDGEKVKSNFKLASIAYDEYRKTGKLPTDLKCQRPESINGNLKKINNLLLEHNGDASKMSKYLLQEKSIKNINIERKSAGLPPIKSDWPVEFEAPLSSSVFGAKLGMFYANLSGLEKYPTLDRWWSRTFNRYRGSLIPSVNRGVSTKGKSIGIDNVKELLGNPKMSDDEAILHINENANNYKNKGYKNGTEIEKASNTIFKQINLNINDAPFNKTDRLFMYDAFKKAQKTLKNSGLDMSIADIQAVLWYYEKFLYKTLGAKGKIDGVSYGDVAKSITDLYKGNNNSFEFKIKDDYDSIEGGEDVEMSAEESTSELEQQPKSKQSLVDDAKMTKDMTEDEKGNYLFYHYSPGKIPNIDPRHFGKNLRTGRDERPGIGVSMYYTRPDRRDVGGSYGYVVRVPKDKVYPFNSDPMNLMDKAKATFEKMYPGQAFDKNKQVAFVSQEAAKAGYDMTVAKWGNDLRAQTTKVMKGETYEKPHPDYHTSTVFNPKLEKYVANENKPKSKQQVDAYHGSPHDFDEFKMEKIGTGEGAQAFGHGLYFTDLRDIAKSYANKLSNVKAVLYDGKTKYELNTHPMVKMFLLDLEQSSPKTKADALNWLEKNKRGKSERVINELSEAIDKISITEKGTPNIYDVSLHEGKTPEQYTWLEWRESVPEEKFNRIKEGLKGKGYTIQNDSKYGFDLYSNKGLSLGHYNKSETGRVIYKNISNALGGGQEASSFLLENGIDGVKYPAESIARGATSENARGSNYVVFDEKAVTIKAKSKQQLSEEEKKTAISEIESGKVGSGLGLAVGRLGLALHSTKEGKWDKVDESKIIGGNRAVYGWGVYFTPDRYKYEEFGGKDVNKLVGIKVSDFDFVNTDEKLSDNIKSELESASKNEDLSDAQRFIAEGILKQNKKYSNSTLDESIKNFLAGVHPSYEKAVSLFFKKIGYDGFKNSNQYVLFNFDKSKVHTDLKSLVEEASVESPKSKQQLTFGDKTNIQGVDVTIPDAKEQEALKDERTKKRYFDESVSKMKTSGLSKDQVEKLLDGDNMAILTGTNPDGNAVSDKTNKLLNQKAEKWLQDNGYKYYEVTGKYGQTESSFLVEGMTADRALEFAKEFKQDSVAHSEGLIYSDNTIEKRDVNDDAFDVDVTDPGADFVSAIKTNDGKTFGFQIGIDFSERGEYKPKSKQQLSSDDIRDNMDKMFEDYSKKMKGRPVEDVVNQVIDEVQHDWVKEGREIDLENAIRSFKKDNGIKVKTPPSQAKISGEKPKKITVTERTALKDQIKLEIKAANEGAKSVKDAMRSIADNVSAMVKSGSITTKQAAVLNNRLTRVNIANPDMVDRYLDYAEKVFNDADYADKLNEARSINAKVNKAIKSKEVESELRMAAKEFTKANVTKVEDIDAHLEMGRRLLDATSSSGIGVKEGEISDRTRKAINIKELSDYTDEVAQKIAEADEANLLEATGIDVKSEEPDTVAPSIEDYIRDRFNAMADSIRAMIKSGISPIDGEKYDLSDEDKIKLSKLVKMTADDIVDPKDKIRALEAMDHLLTNGIMGRIPYILNKIKMSKDVDRGISERVRVTSGKVGLLAIENAVQGVRKILSFSGNSKFYHALLRNSARRIDNVIKNYTGFEIFNNGIKQIAQGESSYKTDLNTMNSDKLKNELVKSMGGDFNKVIESGFKMTMYLRQLEHESNPGSKKSPPAMAFVEKTIEASMSGKHPMNEKSAKLLKKLSELYSTDGSIDSKKIWDSFSPAEKKVVEGIRKLYDTLTPYAQKVASEIHDQPFDPFENYTTIVTQNTSRGAEQVLNEKGKLNAAIGITPAGSIKTKAGQIEERTGQASPINFDPFSSANKAVRNVMLDYHMTLPLRTMSKITDGFIAKSLEMYKADPSKENESRLLFAKAMRKTFEDVLEATLSRSFFHRDIWSDVRDYVSRASTTYMLSNPSKAASEAVSNLSYVVPNYPGEMALGITEYKDYSLNGVGGEIMRNLNSYATDRAYPHGTLSGAFLSPESYEISTNDMQNVRGFAVNAATKAYYNSLMAPQKGLRAVSETMMTAPDLAIIRPLWFGSMAKNFKKLTGQDIDFEAIAKNDVNYLDKFEDALNKSRDIADKNVTDTGAAKNPWLMSPITVKRHGTLLGQTQNYLANYSRNEYEITTDAIIAMHRGGKISRADAAKQISGVLLRAGTYTSIRGVIASGLAAAGIAMHNFLYDDDDKDELTQAITEGRADSKETRKIAAKNQINFLTKTSPRIPGIDPSIDLNNVMMTSDKNKFTMKELQERASDENTFSDNFIKGVGSFVAQGVLGRNFGNIQNKFFTSTAVEYLNAKYLHPEDYNRYKNNILYSSWPDFNSKDAYQKTVEAAVGPYGKASSAAWAVGTSINDYLESQSKIKAIDENLRKIDSGEKVPVEQSGLDYRDKLIKEKNKLIRDNKKNVPAYFRDAIISGLATMGALPGAKDFENVMTKAMKPTMVELSDYDELKEKYKFYKGSVKGTIWGTPGEKDDRESEYYKMTHAGFDLTPEGWIKK